MVQTSVISDIPPERIDALVADHKEMGAINIEVIKQANGLFTLKVTYSSDEDEYARRPSYRGV